MKRRLIKQASQAVTITLPIDWIRNNGLKAGDEIDVRQSEDNLILNAGKKTVTGKLELNTTGFHRRVYFLNINAAYARGIDEIYLENDKYPELTQTIGYAVVSQKGDKYVIRDVAGKTMENLDDIFKRIFQIVLGFYDAAINDVLNKNAGEDYETLKKMDAEINRFVLFLQRSIMKFSHSEPINARILFAYSFALEKLGDEILRFWRAALKGNIKKDPKIKEIILLSKKALERAFEIYYFSNYDKIKKTTELRDSIRDKSIKLMNLNQATTELLIHAVRISDDSYDLVHLSLMKKFNPEINNR